MNKLNYFKLQKLCLSTADEIFKGYQTSVVNPDTLQRYIYMTQPSSKILLVNHADTVIIEPSYGKYLFGKHEYLISAQMDDRLGIWLAQELIRTAGIPLDHLITDNEESCVSTAQYFTTKVKYDLILEIDRHSSLPVIYQYHNPKFEAILSKIYGSIALGSYSDICDLYELGVCGANLPCGHNENHDEFSRVEKSVLESMYFKALTLLQAVKGKHFKQVGEIVKYTPVPYVGDGMNKWYKNADGEWVQERKIWKRGRFDDDEIDYSDRFISKEYDHDHNPVGLPAHQTMTCDFCLQPENSIKWNSAMQAWLCADCEDDFTSGRMMQNG